MVQHFEGYPVIMDNVGIRDESINRARGHCRNTHTKDYYKEHTFV